MYRWRGTSGPLPPAGGVRGIGTVRGLDDSAALTDSRCRAGTHCTALTTDGPASTVKHDTLCPSCVTAIQKQLDELPHLRVAARAFLRTGMQVSYDSKVGGTREPRVPINIHVLDLLDEIDDAIDYADKRTIEDLVRQPSMGFIIWSPRDRDDKVTYLDGVDRALIIRQAHKKASDAVGLAPQWQRRVAPCPVCNQQTLGQWSGEDRIQCSDEDCAAFLSKTDYEQYCTLLSTERNA